MGHLWSKAKFPLADNQKRSVGDVADTKSFSQVPATLMERFAPKQSGMPERVLQVRKRWCCYLLRNYGNSHKTVNFQISKKCWATATPSVGYGAKLFKLGRLFAKNNLTYKSDQEQQWQLSDSLEHRQGEVVRATEPAMATNVHIVETGNKQKKLPGKWQEGFSHTRGRQKCAIDATALTYGELCQCRNAQCHFCQKLGHCLPPSPDFKKR